MDPSLVRCRFFRGRFTIDSIAGARSRMWGGNLPIERVRAPPALARIVANPSRLYDSGDREESR
jgi:hypothetical protein